MRTTILFPFCIDTDFQMGYAWSAELARRLKAKLSLFTTLDSYATEPVADVYKALATAQGFYIRYFQVVSLKLPPVKSERHWVEGDFAGSFRTFVEKISPGIMVLQSGIFSNDLLKWSIASGKQVIVLPSIDLIKESELKKDRSQLFIAIMAHAALYNTPDSFFNIISKDRGLYNAITRFFKK